LRTSIGKIRNVRTFLHALQNFNYSVARFFLIAINPGLMCGLPDQ